MVVILSSLHKYVPCHVYITTSMVNVPGQAEQVQVIKDDFFRSHLVRHDLAHEHIMFAFCELNQIHMPAKSAEFAGGDQMTAARTRDSQRIMSNSKRDDE